MSEYIVDGAEPNSTVLKSTTSNGYEHEKWLPVREEIVRCRDCKHFEYCQFHRHSENKPNGFCAWGKLRGEGDAE